MQSLVSSQNDRSLSNHDLKLFSKIVYRCQPLVVIPVQETQFLFGDQSYITLTSVITIVGEITENKIIGGVVGYLKSMYNDSDVIAIQSYKIEPVTNGFERGHYIRLKFAHIERNVL